MKKLSFKAVALVVMALILVFALVACGETASTGGGGSSQKYTGADFFTNLTESVKSIGKEPIDANEDIQASLAINLALEANGIADLDLSLLLDVVYDRAENGVGNTFSAAHIAIVDNNGSLTSAGQNIVSANYYINEPTKLYLELCNEKVVLQFDATGDGNKNFATYLTNFLTSTFTAGLFEGLSIDGMIETVVETFGPDFAIDNLATAIGALFGFDLNELIVMAADLLGLTEDVANLNGLLSAAGSLLIADGSVKKTTEGTSTVWEATLSGTVTNLVGDFASGLLDSQSAIKLITKVDAEGGIENFAVTANTAPFGDNNVRYNAKIAIDTFEIKGIGNADGSELEINKSEYSEDYTVEANLSVGVEEGLVKLTFDALNSLPDQYDDGSYSFKYIATEMGKSALLTNGKITMPAGDEIAGKLDIRFLGKIALLNNDFTQAYADITYNGKLIAKAIYTQDASGVGTVQIQITEYDEKGYIKMVRDNLIIMAIENFYNAPDKAEYGNYTTLLGDLFAALEDGDVKNIEFTGLELQPMFQSLFFNDDVQTEASAEDMLFLNVVKVEDKALSDVFVKVADNEYKKVIEVFDSAKENADGKMAVAGPEGSQFEGKFVIYDYISKENQADIVYNYAQLFAIYSSQNISLDTSYEASFNISAIFTTVTKALTYAAENKQFSLVSMGGLWNTLFAYDGGDVATGNGIIESTGGIDWGYNIMGILNTGAINQGGYITGYESISNAEDLYAIVYTLSNDVIKRYTDAGLVPAVKMVSNDNSGKYVYTTDYVLVPYVSTDDEAGAYNLKLGRWDIEYVYEKVDGINVFYQTSATISKDMALMIWGITANDINDADVLQLMKDYGYTTQDYSVNGVISADNIAKIREELYNDGIVKELLDMFAGSAILKDVTNGNEFFNKLLAYDAKVVLKPASDSLGLSVQILDSKGKVLASAELGFKVIGDSTELANKVTGFGSFTADLTVDCSVWMP